MKFIPDVVVRNAGRLALHVQKASPNLLFGAGVVGVIGAAVLASRATLKLEGVLNDTDEKLNTVRSIDLSKERYSDEDRRRDMVILRVTAAVEVAKLYAPAVLVGAASVGLLTGSHVVLTRRNAALTAAYAAIDKGFKEYRGRVVKDLGEEKDRDYSYGVETEKVTVSEGDGKKKTIVKKYATAGSPYSVFFHEGNPNYQQIPEYNYMFLRGVQYQATQRLQARGHLFLNEVLDDLGFERTSAGAVVGWLANGNGDGYVDFGIFDDADMLTIFDHVTGREKELRIEFNVDGTIYDKI